MPVGAVIQARMNSRRFPGKVLAELQPERSVLQFLVESVRQCHALDEIVVAASIHSADDAIEQCCERLGVRCFRGDEQDVAKRLCDLVRDTNWHAFVRLSGDSPLLDHRLITRGLEVAAGSQAELVTNIFPAAFPGGQTVEVLRCGTLLRCYERFQTDFYREQVTTFFYHHAREFAIRNFSALHARSTQSFAVDLPDDLRRLSNLVAAMDRPHWDYSLTDLIELSEQNRSSRQAA